MGGSLPPRGGGSRQFNQTPSQASASACDRSWAQAVNNVKPRFSGFRIWHHAKSRQTEFMHKNHKDQNPSNQQGGLADVDLTSVFRAVGLPLTVSATTAFATKYQLLNRENGSHDHVDIIWGVRSAIVGCLPARTLRTCLGKVLLVEFPSFQRGACDVDVRIVIWLTDQSRVCLMLPEEYQEPSAAPN